MTETRGAGVLVAIAALTGGLAVALGAYGAHGLQGEDEIEKLWNTGVSYQMWHALGAVAAAWISTQRVGRSNLLALASGWAMLIGAYLFASILYYFASNGSIFLQGAAPVGGFFMIGGWVGLAISALWRSPRT